MNTRTEPSTAPGHSFLLPLRRLGDRRIPHGLVRGAIALVSGLIAAIGWASIQINGGGGPTYDGSFDLPAEPIALFGIALAVVAAVLPQTKPARFARAVAAVTLWLWAGTAAVGSFSEWVSYFALTGALAIVWPRLTRPLRDRWRESGVPALRSLVRRLLPAVPMIVVAVTTSLAVVGSTQSALAQTATCGDSDVTVTFETGSTIAVLPMDGSPGATVDLREGDTSLRFEATHHHEEARTVSVSLDRTSPIDLIRGDEVLLFHEVIQRGGTTGGELLISTSNTLRRYEIAVLRDGSLEATSPGPVFTGGAIAAVQLTDSEGTVLCRSEVPIRIAGSSWRTPAGLAAIAALGVGTARACQPMLRPPLRLDPEKCIVSVRDPRTGTAQVVSKGDCVQLTAGVDHELRVQLRFVNLAEDEDAAAALVDRYDGTIRIRDVGSILTVGPQLEVGGGQECSLLSQMFATEASADGSVSLAIGGSEPIEIGYRAASAELSDEAEEEE